VRGGIAYLADNTSRGTWTVDISNPAAPIILMTNNPAFPYFDYGFLPPTDDLTIRGDYLYAVGPSYSEGSTSVLQGLRIFDISNPVGPVLKGSLFVPGTLRAIEVSENTAYVANDISGLRTIDISNPAAPKLLGTYDTPGRAVGVTVAGNRVYVADLDGGLLIFDVSNPATPVRIGRYNTYPEAWHFSVQQNIGILANGSGPLQILNLADPIAPSFVITPPPAMQVSLVGETGRKYIIDTASVLETNAWTSLSTLTLTNTSQTIPLTNAGAQQFFRARVGP
jgi:hypothetical protein